MPKINILPKSVAELIAAGEVVERPASAIKEMVENAIDAGSKKITVEIQNGGVRYMRITDDGCGIAREDIRNAFVSHATSKVAVAEDLNAIFTLGFRGEALASIAAVAKVEMLTKPVDSDFGTRYVIEGGEEILLDDAGCPDGTTIVVRELFYNTPARMKFLKKDMTEGNYVSDIVTKIALANPGVSFRLIKDGKQVLFTSGDGKLQNVAAAVFGKDFASSLICCDYELNGVKASGFVSVPGHCKPTRNSQYFFVNSRFVKIPAGSAALDEAYRNTIMVGKFPACIINLTIPPETVDVNVHPAKTEVRFSDDKRIFEAIYYAAKNAVTQKDIRPKMDLSVIDRPEPFRGEQVHIPVADMRTSVKPNVPAVTEVKPLPEKRPDPIPNVYVYTVENKDIMQAASPKSKEEIAVDITVSEPSDLPVRIMPETREEKVDEIIERMPDENTESLTEPPKKELPYFRYLGEAFKTYLLCECEEKLLVIDKHALHERMLFNEIKAGGVCMAPQALMIAETVHLPHKEYIAVTENPHALSKLGFTLEDFGEGTILVRECPMMFADENIASVVSELAGELLKHSKELMTEKLDWLYHSASCRAAVKGGKPIIESDAVLLIEKVLTDDSLRYCPHGRPVLIELTRRELEKQFGRIQ